MRVERTEAMAYVSFVVDDAGNGRELGEDLHAIVRESFEDHQYASVLVGWQCGFEPLFVAVHSYLDVYVDDGEAIELATDFLSERGWFANNEVKEPDYLIR